MQSIHYTVYFGVNVFVLFLPRWYVFPGVWPTRVCWAGVLQPRQCQQHRTKRLLPVDTHCTWGCVHSLEHTQVYDQPAELPGRIPLNAGSFAQLQLQSRCSAPWKHPRLWLYVIAPPLQDTILALEGMAAVGKLFGSSDSQQVSLTVQADGGDAYSFPTITQDNALITHIHQVSAVWHSSGHSVKCTLEF